MAPRTIVKNNKTDIPKELIDLIPNIKAITWNIKNETTVELEFEMNEECEEFAKELEEISADMDAGNKTKLDVKSFAKEHNL
ncbi:hypothetical protein [Methanobrevibacter curvatus]|uniref:Uncharacterized protein n=1 Tax=Methanobrevibacter curvatus TaxID=49547 RepID=A0A166AAB2_9EURY|nr:hypothetical protein [Methanobrevibacter curvatus]KZX11781.1 hypothetical protein MBCUR_12800 [Methanobrevibacter curvatus]